MHLLLKVYFNNLQNLILILQRIFLVVFSRRNHIDKNKINRKFLLVNAGRIMELLYLVLLTLNGVSIYSRSYLCQYYALCYRQYCRYVFEPYNSYKNLLNCLHHPPWTSNFYLLIPQITSLDNYFWPTI